jgi:hypothetical protein
MATRWLCREAGDEKANIKWEVGGQPVGVKIKYERAECTYLSYLLKPEHGFQWEENEDGGAALSRALLEAAQDPIEPTVHILARGNTDDLEWYVARAQQIVAPAYKYFVAALDSVGGVKGRHHLQLQRMRAARNVFNPVVAFHTPVTDKDIATLSQAFRCMRHPLVAATLLKMPAELPKYNALASAITIIVSGEFDIQAWWKMHKTSLPAFTQVLRAVLTNSPNSCPPERVFSILNDTFSTSQKTTKQDHLQLSLQLQYNSRGR